MAVLGLSLALALCLWRRWHDLHIRKPLVSGRILLAFFFCNFWARFREVWGCIASWMDWWTFLVGCECLPEGFRVFKSQVMLRYFSCCSRFFLPTDKLPAWLNLFLTISETVITLLSVSFLVHTHSELQSLWWDSSIFGFLKLESSEKAIHCTLLFSDLFFPISLIEAQEIQLLYVISLNFWHRKGALFTLHIIGFISSITVGIMRRVVLVSAWIVAQACVNISPSLRNVQCFLKGSNRVFESLALWFL